MSMAMFLIFCQKEPGTKTSKGAKGKKDEKQEAAKEGTTPSENGENKAEEVLSTHTSCWLNQCFQLFSLSNIVSMFTMFLFIAQNVTADSHLAQLLVFQHPEVPHPAHCQ